MQAIQLFHNLGLQQSTDFCIVWTLHENPEFEEILHPGHWKIFILNPKSTSIPQNRQSEQPQINGEYRLGREPHSPLWCSLQKLCEYYQ